MADNGGYRRGHTMLTPRIQASDPMRLSLGGSHGSSENPADDPAIRHRLMEGDPGAFYALLEHIQTQYQALHELLQHLRLQRRRVWVEHYFSPLDSTAYPEETTNQDVRITYIFAFIGGGKTGNFNLRGGKSQTTFSLPIPANTQPPLILPLGDGETGGIVLRPQDTRYISTSDGSNQQIIGLLCGEVLSDTYLS